MPRKWKAPNDEAAEEAFEDEFAVRSVVVASDAANEEAPIKKKKKKRIGDEDLAVTDIAAVDADAPVLEGEAPPRKKLKKARKEAAAAEAAAAEAAAEAEKEAEPPKKKKKKKEAVADDSVVETEAAAEAEAPAKDASGENLCRQLYVRGIPWSVTEDAFRKDFGECGEISDLQMMKDRVTGLPKGIAFITYSDEAGVKAALAYDGEDYGGRVLEVRREDGNKGKGKGKDGKSMGGNEPKENEVFIRGLGPKTKEATLHKEFSKCGEIARLKMDIDIGDGGKCKGYAWITYADEAGMHKALQRHRTMWGDSELAIERSGQHRKGKGDGKSKGAADAGGVEVFIRGLPRATEEDVVRRDFSECGELARVNMPLNNDGSCKGFAWLSFKTQDGANKACDFNGTDYGGSKLMAEIAGQHKGRPVTGKGRSTLGVKPPGCISVVVKKLSYEAIESDLKKVFAKCGSGPTNVKILTDWETGKSKGIAFVDFADDKAVDEAIKLTGGVIKGHTFFLDYAKPLEPRID